MGNKAQKLSQQHESTHAPHAPHAPHASHAHAHAHALHAGQQQLALFLADESRLSKPLLFRPLLQRLRATRSKRSLESLAALCLAPQRNELLKGFCEAMDRHVSADREKSLQFFAWAYLVHLYLWHGDACPLFHCSPVTVERRNSFRHRSSRFERRRSSSADSLDPPPSAVLALRFEPLAEAVDRVQVEGGGGGGCNWQEAMRTFVERYMPDLESGLSLGLQKLLLGGGAGEAGKEAGEAAGKGGTPAKSDYSKCQLATQLISQGLSGVLLDKESQCFSDDGQIFALMQLDSSGTSTRWTNLFSDKLHGRSFARMAPCFLDYPGRLALVARTTTDCVLGAFIKCGLQETNGKFVGNDETILFTLQPRYQVFRSVGRASNFVYVNTKNSFYPKGLGFGGQLDCFRLWISDSFDDCYVTSADSTYEPGDLLSEAGAASAAPAEFNRQNFQLLALEWWACGLPEDMERMRGARQRDEQLLRERQQVDRAKFAGNAFDREFLLGNNFSTQGGASS